MAWLLRRRTSMPEVVGSISAQVRPHSNTFRQGMYPWLLPDCTEGGSIGAQNVQHLKICWRSNGVLSPGGNVRLLKSCEWLLQPVQDYKPIPFLLPLHFLGYRIILKYLQNPWRNTGEHVITYRGHSRTMEWSDIAVGHKLNTLPIEGVAEHWSD